MEISGSPPATAVATAADRIAFTLFLALAAHATALLGLAYTENRKPSHPETTLEVTLVPEPGKQGQEEADFLAQFNQSRSGAEEETGPLDSLPASWKSAQAPEPGKPYRRNHADPATRPGRDATDYGSNTSPEAAHLLARLQQQRELYAKRPRITRLTSVSAKASVTAHYLDSWRRRIETVGNQNYPEEARHRELYGNLRVLVSILPDGSVKAIRILESSGEPVLDEAAKNIVRLSAPFSPFPDQLRSTTDILEIIRTWQFRKNRTISS